MKKVKQILFYAALLLIWQSIVWAGIWPKYSLPSPSMVLEAMWYGLQDNTVPVAVGISLKRIVMGYILSVVLGIILGFLIATSEFLESTLGKLVLGLQSLPSVCWLPLAILWFGLNEQAILFVTVMGSVLAISISTETGLRHVPHILLQAGKNLGATGTRQFLHVLLPASSPHLISGLKQGWAFAWRSLISGEMLFVSLGLGHLLMMARDLNDMSLVIAVMIMIMLLGYAVDMLLFEWIERRMKRRWGLTRG